MRESETATTNMRLRKKPSENIDLVCERQLRAFHMSKRTKQVNVIVVSRGVTFMSLFSLCGGGIKLEVRKGGIVD